jgi:hypothetical protein
LPSLILHEAKAAEPECENRYIDAVKQSTKPEFAAAKALAGSFFPMVE